MEAMKRMAVIKVATSIRRTKLMSMRQEPGQSIREFYANAKSQADPEIRRDVLELSDFDKMSTINLVGFIEGKKVARKAWSTEVHPDIAALTSQQVKTDPFEAKLTLKTTCSLCGVKMAQFSNNRFGRINKTPYTKCAKCFKESSSKSAPKSEQASL